eukprot:m.284228 g.284228  ORF g.284228 m.284228 type:complete len:206 (-) comp16196_c0_seq10:1979-2596(-)
MWFLIVAASLGTLSTKTRCVTPGSITQVENTSAGFWCAPRGVLHQGDLAVQCNGVHPTIDCEQLALVPMGSVWYGNGGLSSINLNASNTSHLCFGVTCITRQLCGALCATATTSPETFTAIPASDYTASWIALVGTFVYFCAICSVGRIAERCSKSSKTRGLAGLVPRKHMWVDHSQEPPLQPSSLMLMTRHVAREHGTMADTVL